MPEVSICPYRTKVNYDWSDVQTHQQYEVQTQKYEIQTQKFELQTTQYTKPVTRDLQLLSAPPLPFQISGKSPYSIGTFIHESSISAHNIDTGPILDMLSNTQSNP
jgi:hypothetical protein